MKVEDFLARVVAPGNFICIAWKNPTQGGMAHRFYPRENVGEAGGFLKWLAGKGNDAWFTPFAFRQAEQETDNKGKPRWVGERTHENAEAVRAFWIDADVRRDGDKKGSNVYDTKQDAILWLKQFLNATGMLAPNMVVNSGYGLHFYWVLEDAMTRDEWQPYANAFHAAIKQHGFKSEGGITSDAARLLRPPETLNLKAGPPGVPVAVMPMQKGDYPNAMVLDKLQPYVGIIPTVVPSQAPAPQATNLASNLSTGGPAPIFNTARTPNLNAAAQANMPASAQREFKHIIPKCLQVQESLKTGGKDDSRPLWYLGFLSLAHHCSDGQPYAHELGKGHPGYSQADTDAMLAQIAREKAKKDHGPPRCASFDLYRSGICQKCPHFNRVTSPWVLGIAQNDGDLPPGYIRKEGKLQVMNKEAGRYLPVVDGDVYSPIVEQLRKGYRISFMYEYAGKAFEVTATNSEALGDAGKVGTFFVDQSVALKREEFGGFGTFVAAWITHIRAQKGERTEVVPPFGYATTLEGDHVGVAIAGVLYRSDGTTEAAPLHDTTLKAAYTPHGYYNKWREAFDLVTDWKLPGSIQRQAIVATAFGAPMLKFTGQKGLLVSAWSTGSGKAKTAALMVAQSVYAKPSTMNVLKTTTNAANMKMSVTQIMPSYWDEMRIEKGQAHQLIENIFGIAQGQDKGRLGPDLVLRESNPWQTIACVASNTRLMDYIIGHASAGEAGSVRLFEFDINTPDLKGTAEAARTIDNTQRHFGHAGHQFIQYIAMNFTRADGLVRAFSKKVLAVVGEQGEERMYVAGVSAMLAGAYIADEQKIARFDIKGLFNFYCDTILSLRRDRGNNIMTGANGSGIDAQDIIADYTSSFAGDRLVTDRMFLGGNSPQVATIDPPKSGKPLYQRADDDQLLLLLKKPFDRWCRELRGLNATTVVTELEKQLGANVGKRTLGASTGHVMLRQPTILIPLSALGGAPSTAQATAVQAKQAIGAAVSAAQAAGQALPP